MSHELEMVNNEAAMAYVGSAPWHKLGTEVADDLSVPEFMEAAKINWEVEKQPMTYSVDNEVREVNGKKALVRSTDGQFLSVVGDSWHPCQNTEAFSVFEPYVEKGLISMETAGSLKDGKVVWGLAKVNNSFDIFKGDVIDSYLLIMNPHRAGKTILMQSTPVRVVCNNTLTLSLSSATKIFSKQSHRQAFDPELFTDVLDEARLQMDDYKEAAEFLGSKNYRPNDAEAFMSKLFPTREDAKRENRAYNRAMEVIDTQPGADFAPGTYWNLFNAATYIADHELGRSEENRFLSTHTGNGRALKQKAMNLALEMSS